MSLKPNKHYAQFWNGIDLAQIFTDFASLFILSLEAENKKKSIQ